jgi:exodeoxyribonuclease VII large subunit
LIDGALSVTEVSARLKGAVEGALGQVWVKGELAELKVYASGHWYFTLRDRECQVRCVMWRTYAQQIKARPPEGAEVFVRARPDFWQERGEVRLSAVALLRTEGVGDAERALRQAREALERDGLLDPARKRPLPPFPMRVAIVTSVEGAALQDMVTVTRRRWPAGLLVVGSTVQGEAAERDLLRALALVNRLRADLCIVGRGGGSREDLAAFNLESVCRAIAAVRVPVISAVGHQTDVTLADLVADRRAETPSAAIEMALPDQAEVQAALRAQGTRLATALRRRTRLAEERLYRAEDRMRHVVERRLEGSRERLGRLGAQLDALSPLRVLGRGYAVARDEAGRVLRRMEDFPEGLGFRLRVSDGDVEARVEGP